ncbi:hypothetical protein ABPG75_002870 [Micractinium tetrahymenae]
MGGVLARQAGATYYLFDFREEEQLRLRPYEEPKWRANIDKRRFSEVKLLCEYIEARALEHQKATGRVWSRPQMARQLENERRTAGQGGKEQGLTSLVKQLQKQRKEASKRADETAAALEAAPEGEQEGS